MLLLAGFCGVYSGCVEEGCGDCRRRNDRVRGGVCCSARMQRPNAIISVLGVNASGKLRAFSWVLSGVGILAHNDQHMWRQAP